MVFFSVLKLWQYSKNDIAHCIENVITHILSLGIHHFCKVVCFVNFVLNVQSIFLTKYLSVFFSPII